MAIAKRNFLADQQALREKKEKEKAKAKETAQNAADIKAERQQQLDDENRIFERSKQGLNAKTDAQLRLQREGSDTTSRLQSERAGQSLQSQREGVEGNSRLQRERAGQSLESQRQGVEGNSRLQSERSAQSLVSQKEGVEGSSRLQREGSEQRGKLQSQAAAEAAARKAGDRAAAMSSFSKFGKGR